MKKKLKIILIMTVVSILLICSFFITKKIYMNNIVKDIEITDTTKISTDNIELPTEIKESDNIGTLTIPTIYLEKAPIKEGTELSTLADAIGHFTSTSIFNGNVGLASHNRGSNASYFANIHKLKKGDNIYFESIYGTKKYSVESILEISETDFSYLQDTKDNRLTLITCIKNKPEKRLCVQAIENFNN